MSGAARFAHTTRTVGSFWADDDVHGHAGEVVDVEESAVEAMRTGLQCSHLAADTVFSQTKALTGALSMHTTAALFIATYSPARDHISHCHHPV